jgi:hypothetical protein
MANEAQGLARGACRHREDRSTRLCLSVCQRGRGARKNEGGLLKDQPVTFDVDDCCSMANTSILPLACYDVRCCVSYCMSCVALGDVRSGSIGARPLVVRATPVLSAIVSPSINGAPHAGGRAVRPELLAHSTVHHPSTVIGH